MWTAAGLDLLQSWQLVLRDILLCHLASMSEWTIRHIAADSMYTYVVHRGC